MAVSGRAAASRSLRVVGAMGDALIHQLQGAVAARAADVAGIPDPVPGLEQGHLAAGGTHPQHPSPVAPGIACPLALGRVPWCRLTEVALTRTSRSRGPGVGSGRFVSMKQWGGRLADNG